MHLIAFWRTQHDEVQILRPLWDVEGHRALLRRRGIAVRACAVRQVCHETVASARRGIHRVVNACVTRQVFRGGFVPDIVQTGVIRRQR